MTPKQRERMKRQIEKYPYHAAQFIQILIDQIRQEDPDRQAATREEVPEPQERSLGRISLPRGGGSTPPCVVQSTIDHSARPITDYVNLF